jgi:hypothetical protein
MELSKSSNGIYPPLANTVQETVFLVFAKPNKECNAISIIVTTRRKEE